MATWGPWTDGSARLIEHGGLHSIKDGGRKTYDFTDVYAVTLAEGAKPTSATVVGVPALGASGVYDEHTLVLQDLSWRQDDPRSLIWYCDAKYATAEPDNDTTTSGDDMVIITVDFATRANGIDMEIDQNNGTPLLNAAGERYQDAITTDQYSPTMVIKCEQSRPRLVDDITNYAGSINAYDVTIRGLTVPAYCGLLTVDAQDLGETSGGEVLYACTYTIETKSGNIIDLNAKYRYAGATQDYTPTSGESIGYRMPILNVGYSYLDGNQLYRFYDVADNGKSTESTDPKMLKFDGTPSTDKKAYYTMYFPHRVVDWSLLVDRIQNARRKKYR